MCYIDSLTVSEMDTSSRVSSKSSRDMSSERRSAGKMLQTEGLLAECLKRTYNNMNHTYDIDVLHKERHERFLRRTCLLSHAVLQSLIAKYSFI